MEALRAEGAFCWKVWGNDAQMAGLPDICGVVDGLFFGIETKNPESRDKVSPIQQLRHDQIFEAGGVVKVCCSAAEAVAFVTDLRINFRCRAGDHSAED